MSYQFLVLYDSGYSNRLCSVIKHFWLNFFCFQTTNNSSIDMLVPDCNLQLVVQMILEVKVVLKITQTFFWLKQSLGTRNRLITVYSIELLYRCISSPTFISVSCYASTVSNLYSSLLHLHLMLFLKLLRTQLFIQVFYDI